MILWNPQNADNAKKVTQMKYATSFQELDSLGEGLSKDYLRKSHKQNELPFDIEGFITGYLGLTIIYENFAEEDRICL